VEQQQLQDMLGLSGHALNFDVAAALN